MNTQLLLLKVSIYLAHIIPTYIKVQNRAGLFDINTLSQDFLIPVLNPIFKANFKNLDLSKPNNEAIDLGDEVKKISFQITSDNSFDKVKHTIDKFFTGKNSYYRSYDQLYHLIISEKQSTGYNQKKIDQHIKEVCKSIDQDSNLRFRSNQNILDLYDIVKIIRQQLSEGIINSDDLEKITERLEKEAKGIIIEERTGWLNFLESDINHALDKTDFTKDQIEDLLEFIKQKFSKSSESSIGKELYDALSRMEILTSKFAESIEDFKAYLSNLNLSSDLTSEWIKQVDEIDSNLNEFYPKTALKRINLLIDRVSSDYNEDNKILGKLYYLKGQSSQLIKDIELKEISHSFIEAHKLCPNDMLYKIHATFAYFKIKEFATAIEKADELLSIDRFNHMAWAIKLFTHQQSISSFLKRVPEETKHNRLFLATVINWHTVKYPSQKNIRLSQLGLSEFKFDKEEPKKISFRNFNFWMIITQYYLNNFFSVEHLVNLFFISPYYHENKTLNFIISLLNKISAAIKGSEIGDDYRYFEFILKYLTLINEGKKETAIEVETAFRNLHIHDEQTILLTCQALCYRFQNERGINHSIDIIEKYGQDNSIRLKYALTLYYFEVNEIERAHTEYSCYLRLTEETTITETDAINLILVTTALLSKSKIDLEVLEKLEFESNEVKSLVKFIIESHEPNRIISDKNLEDIKNLTVINGINHELKKHFARSLLNYKRYDAAIDFLDHIDKETPSEELKLYCEALYYSNRSNTKRKLLPILVNWRNLHTPVYSLLRAEIHLRNLLHHWEEIEAICEIGIKQYPEDEVFFSQYIHALNSNLKVDKILSILSKILEFNFESEENAIVISNILRVNGFNKESLELFYKVASVKENTLARQSFFTSAIEYPNSFVDFNEVQINRYVKYECDGKISIVHIDENNVNNSFIKSLLNKSVGETFYIKSDLTKALKQGKILRIMNKYMALSAEIMEEAENPSMGYKMESLKVDYSNGEDINAQMIEQFGAEGTVEKEFRIQKLADYKKGKLSFAEIIRSNYRGKSVNGYYGLTLTDKFFRSIPKAYFSQNLNDYKNFVLDASALCLFFNLSDTHGFTFRNKFVISPFLKDEIQNEIYQLKFTKQPELSVEVTLDGVKPHFIPKEYAENRLVFLEKIVDWITYNCILKSPDSVLDFALLIDKDMYTDNHFQTIVDNRLFIDNQEYILITDDINYVRNFRANWGSFICPEYYLHESFPEKSKLISEFLLENNYIGIEVDKTLLSESFKNFSLHKKSYYPLLLQSLNFSWNPCVNHINESIAFVKWIMLSPIYTKEKKQSIAINVLIHLCSGMDAKNRNRLKNLVNKEFKLMGEYLNIMRKTIDEVFIIT